MIIITKKVITSDAADVIMHSQTGERPYQCNQCNKSYTTYHYLKVHMIKHTEERPYNCNQCDKSFKYHNSLTYHMRKHTGESSYQCNLCSKSFASKGNFQIHMRSHTGEGRYNCNQCDKCFKRKRNLTDHMRTHYEERPYNCNQCDKSFQNPSSLIYHRKMHKGESSYQCNQCSKSFTCKIHIIKHTGDKPYKCNQCNKSFARNDQLKIHIRDHTGESHILQNHKSSISVSPDNNVKSRVFACFICKVRFNNLIECRQHMKAHRENIIPIHIKYGSTRQEIAQKDYSRTPTIENRIDIYSDKKKITVTRDQISIKVEQDMIGDLKQELENYIEDKAINPLHKMINLSENDFEKMKIIVTREQVSIKAEQDIVKDTLKQEELDNVDIKVDEDGILDALSLVKEEIKDHDDNSNKDTFSV